MNHELRTQLIEAALAARRRAYAPYSRFQVGAALCTSSGEVITGCNVENVSFGLTNCAERTAVFSAVAAGHQRFDLLAVASAGGVAPCGACRQVLFEFAPELSILLVDAVEPGKVVETNLRDLLPGPFQAFSPQPPASQEAAAAKEQKKPARQRRGAP